MPVPTLRQLSTATAIKNARHLKDIGDLPYALVRPILLKVDNPEQLHTIEQQSPHIAEEDEELWLEFIKRDIPQWNTYELPEHSTHWYELYCDLREQVQRSLEEDAEKMKLALDGINSERARLKPKVVSERARLPGMRPTQKQRYVAYDRKMGGLAPVFGNKINETEWSFQPPSIPRSELPPGQKKKPTIFTPRRRNNVLAVPTKHLNTRATQIKHAPRSLVEEHRRPQEPSALKRNEPTAPIAPGRARQKTASAASPLAAAANGSASSHKEPRAQTVPDKLAPSPSQSSHSPRREAPSPSKGTSPSAINSTLKRPAVSPPEIESRSPSQSSPPSSNDGPSPAKSDQTSSTSTPRPAVMRKRPPPSIFIQPKRKRVS